MGAFKGLEIIEAGIQTGLTTENTSPAYMPFVEGFDLKFNPEMEENRIVNDNGGNQKGLFGNASYGFTGEIQAFAEADSGSPVAPVVDPILKACGFDSATNGTIVYTPCFEGDYSAITMYWYSGQKNSGDCLIKKAKNMMFEGSLVGKVGTPLRLKLNGMGTVSAVPTAGDYPSVSMLDDDIPVLTISTATINDISYKVSEFEIMFGYKVKLLIDGSQYGYWRAQLVPGPAKWTAKVLTEDTATKNPFTPLVGVDNSEFSLITGSGASVITIGSASSSQIMGAEETEDDGVKMFDLNGQFTNNAYSITFDGSGS
jgi:hypothetical protein